jgi:hypothetical protein
MTTVEPPSEPSAAAGDPHESAGWTPTPPAVAMKDADVIACSLENPESCEACQ